MSSHQQKVLAHAEEHLKPGRQKNRSRADLIKLYKRFLKIEENRIRMQHKAGAGGLEIARLRSNLLDITLQNLFADALSTADLKPEDMNRFARDRGSITLIAQGGYGRGTLNPGSDIDLLFLHNSNSRNIAPQTNEIIEQVLYMLWDVGFNVGHAVRSIKECIKLANEDTETKTAIIEARYLTGDEDLFKQFQETFHKNCISGKEKQYLATRADDLRVRHNKYKETVYLQEPQIKEGCGGLRDYQNLIWSTYVTRGTRDIEDLVEEKLLTRSAYRALQRAYEFLMRVRNEMHYSERREADILTLQLQGVVATNLGYPQRTILRRIEEFMRDYYTHTRAIYYHVTSLFQSFRLEEQQQAEQSGLISFLARRGASKKEEFDCFYAKDGLIYPQKANIFVDDPLRMMSCFQHAQRRHLKFSPQIRRAFKIARSVFDRPFLYNKANRETFEAILFRKGDVARILRMMHRVGFLGKYLPEFGALDCLVQHEFYHRYTADEHTLRCIDQLDDLIDTKNPRFEKYQKLFLEVEDPYIHYLALILHDTGRAKNVRHHTDGSTLLAGKVCSRLQIKGERRKRLLFLVDHHLTLYKTATTRNLQDPNTIAEFARAIPNPSYLDSLLLFTFVDSQGTSEDSWTDWKESLILDLYRSTKAYFEDQEGFHARMAGAHAELKAEVSKKLGDEFEDEIEAHFSLMPERYFRFRKPESVVSDMRGFHSFFRTLQKKSENTLTPILKWKAHEDRGYSTVKVFSWNRPLLLARVAGALAARNLNILSADIFTREDDLALDVFRVCTTKFEPVTSKRDTDTVEKVLKAAFAVDVNEFNQTIAAQAEIEYPSVDPNLFPQRVHLTNQPSPDYTVLEIQAVDRIGLLYDILCAIGVFGLDTLSARINTEKGAAIDTFYLTDYQGKKITNPELLEDLADKLEEVLGITTPNTPHSPLTSPATKNHSSRPRLRVGRPPGPP
ncbi:MAG: [protein-PII] uridylyltransferase, partial [Verrucomicrobiota bacterium]